MTDYPLAAPEDSTLIVIKIGDGHEISFPVPNQLLEDLEQRDWPGVAPSPLLLRAFADYVAAHYG